MASSIVPFAGGETIVYTPEASRRAVEELMTTIEELSRRIQVLENLLFMSRDVAPEKPRSPMIAYADGTHWNPGAGSGYYEFRMDLSWHKL